MNWQFDRLGPTHATARRDPNFPTSRNLDRVILEVENVHLCTSRWIPLRVPDLGNVFSAFYTTIESEIEGYEICMHRGFQVRRKDSLRQFVVALFDRKQLRQLASYPVI